MSSAKSCAGCDPELSLRSASNSCVSAHKPASSSRPTRPPPTTLPTMADMGLGRDARYFEELGTKKHGSGTVWPAQAEPSRFLVCPLNRSGKDAL